jgi:hypothetical protein
MAEEWQIIECCGYKAAASIDLEDKVIRCSVFNVSWPGENIEFCADSVSELNEAFQCALDDYFRACRENNAEPLPPVCDQPPPAVLKNYARLLPELQAAFGSQLFMILRILDRQLGTMRRLGFLDISNVSQIKESNQEDVHDALKLILSVAELFIPADTRLYFLSKRLSDDVEMIVSGHQPVFLRVDPFRGTKSSNPKHAALRIECACAVAALMRRGLTRDNACALVQDCLAREGISTHKQGKAISVSTVRSYYNIVRASALKSGPINYEEGPSWPAAAAHKNFYIDKSLVPDEYRFRLEADGECDLLQKFKLESGRDYPLRNGLSPLDNLVSKLKEILPLA